MKQARYVLLVFDADDHRINGTTSPHAERGSRALGYSILRTVAGAASVLLAPCDSAARFDPSDAVRLTLDGPSDADGQDRSR